MLASLAAGLCPDDGPEAADGLLGENGFQVARRRLIDAMERVDPSDPPMMRDLLRGLVLEVEAAAADAMGLYALG